MKEAINNKRFSDITLIASDETRIFAHKIILTSRCEYFKALFESGMKETKATEIPMANLPKTGLLALLEFIYTDNIQYMEPDIALDVLSASSLLNLDRLKVLCESSIIKGVDHESVSFVYQTAKLFGAQKLVQFCQGVIVSEFDRVSKTDSFTQLPLEEINQLKLIY